MAHSAPLPGSVRPELQHDELVRCKAQDPVAFRAFVVRYQRPVFSLLSRMLGRGPHVEDIAQDVFLRAYRAFPSFDVDRAARPSTWLLTIATRAALDVRKRAVVPTTSLEAAGGATTGVTPESERRRGELRTAIAHAADALPDDQRAAFVLAEFHGLTMAEIAAVLEVPENTVKTRIHRARAKLQESLVAHKEDS
ncbi:MAG TPA: sigma-70 family RNA polymerase sigma factor [Kofleriaceae bacterium]